MVDDASQPPLATLLRPKTQLTIIRNESNSGFARSCNVGARAARGRLLLLLNNDTEVLSGWWEPLFEAIEHHAEYGIVAPKLIFADGTIQHCGKVWGDTTAVHAQPQHIYYQFPKNHPAVNTSREYQLVTGACLLVRTTEFLDWGGFDEQYENGWEDDDLCYQCRYHGKHVWYCAESEILHFQNQTLNEQMDALKSRLPELEKLKEIDRTLMQGTATNDEIRLARDVQGIYLQMEKELERFQRKFDKNKSHFMSKWGHAIERDDFRYCQLDGVPLYMALPELYRQNTAA